MTDTLARLFTGRMPDPDGSGALAPPPIEIVIAPSLAGHEEALVARLGFPKRIALVSDTRTRAALGLRVEAALAGAYDVQSVVLEGNPRPDAATVDAVRGRIHGCEALVAIGSGTLNDVTKYAAFQARVPFAVFGTAPSMNGYTSVTAAITVDGHKKSLDARVPAGVFLDLSVLAAAPKRMIRAGFGDSICRATAQVDWLMAHRLRGEPYRRAPFDLLADDEPALLADPAALLTGDLEAMRRLARTLVLSGLGMTICGSSKPASQGEHLISHYIEMMAPASFPPPLHGEQIAVTTVAMARLQERMLSGPPPVVAATATTETDLVGHFGQLLGAACWQDFSRKCLDASEAADLSARLIAEWPALAEELVAVGRPTSDIEAALVAIGAPIRPPALGLTAALWRDAMCHARQIRDRFTFLDLAGDAGMLEAQAAWNN